MTLLLMMDDPDDPMASPSSGSSIGEAASARGRGVTDEDEELYYIPERRPSLDLGPSSMDTSLWCHVEQAKAPAQSYGSLRSEEGIDNFEDMEDCSTRIQMNRADSFSSSYSLDSDDCEKRTPRGKTTEDAREPTDPPVLILNSEEFSHPSLTVAFTFTTISDKLRMLSDQDLKVFKGKLWTHFPHTFITPPQNLDIVNLVDRLLECHKLEVCLQIAKALFKEMGKRSLVLHLDTLCLMNEVRYDLAEILKRKYGEVCEGLTMEGEKRPFDEVYSELFVSKISDYGPNTEHEVLTIEKLHTNQQVKEPLSTQDFFCCDGVQHSHQKFILLTGVAGSGKSMLVRKLILDWTKQQSPQMVSFLFPFTFAELKQFQSREISLLSLIHELYPPTQRLTFDHLKSDDCRVMFIFDGLDEYDDKLDSFNTELYGACPTPTTLNVFLVNLLRARLLFPALFLVTSRSQVKHSIPWDTPHTERQIHGFSEPEKDEYFKKRFRDPDQAAGVISYVKSVKTLHIMCHLPLFCSLVGDECQRVFREQGTQADLPRSLTYMYTKLLMVLIRQRRSCRVPDCSPGEERCFLMKVGKLAFTMLEKGEFKFNKDHDWEGLAIDEREMVDHSGICTQFFLSPFLLYREKVFCFLHPTVQEYMAALYVFLSFANQGKNVFQVQRKGKLKKVCKGPNPMDLYESAVDRSMQRDDGKLDLFLRFLFGMMVKSSQKLLQTLFASSLKRPAVIKDAEALIRRKMKENQHSQRMSNLQHCLEELGV